MDVKRLDYLALFEEALGKAFAAKSTEAREAYLDLATFYQERLPGRPPFDMLQAPPNSVPSTVGFARKTKQPKPSRRR